MSNRRGPVRTATAPPPMVPPPIQSGIPIPRPTRKDSLRCRTSRLLEMLDVGDSFVVPFRERNLARSRMAWMRKRTGRKFTGRSIDDQYRIWRTA